MKIKNVIEINFRKINIRVLPGTIIYSIANGIRFRKILEDGSCN